MTSTPRRFTSCAVLGLLAAMPVRSATTAETPPTTVAVRVTAPAGQSAERWLAVAVEAMVEGELTRFHRVTLVEAPPDVSPSTAKAAGVDVLVVGTLRDLVLEYEVYESWTPARAVHGSVELQPGVSTAVLQQRLDAIVRPIVASGGLVDQKPAPRAADAAEVNSSQRDEQQLALALSLLALAVFMAWPPLLGLLLAGRKLLRRGQRRVWAVPLTCALGFAAAAVALELGLLQRVAADAVAALEPVRPVAVALLPLGSGALWAVFALLNLRVVFPPVFGLRQVRHDALWPLLRAWLTTAGLRALLLLGYVPLYFAAQLAADLAGLPRPLLVQLGFPLLGLLAYLWFLVLVDAVAAYLDDRLVFGAPTSDNAWHPTFKRYFLGYVKRGGLDLDRGELDRLLLLPGLDVPGGPGPFGVTSYGGGLTRPRVLIEPLARDLALGELPDELQMPERSVNTDELPLGALMPGADGPATGQPDDAAQRERRRRAAQVRPRAAAPRLIGQNATLLGWLTPASGDESVPLISNNPEDFDVVRSLLTEHYAAFEKNLDEDDHDDTDPSQRDFLFGALLREVGAVQRHDARLTTLALALKLGALKASRLSRLLLRLAFALSARLASRPPATVADSFVALNRGLDHLIQYLFVLDGGPYDGLTARAPAPELLRTSKELLHACEARPRKPEDNQLLRATPRTRLERLSEYFYSAIAPPPRRVARVLAAVLVLLASGLALGRAVTESIDYHPVYQERMSAQGAADGGTATTTE